MWMLAIVLLLIFVGFGNLPMRGGAADFFVDMLVFFIFAEVFLAITGLPAPHHVATTPTRHSTASLTPPAP
jgi:hypothetical protein